MKLVLLVSSLMLLGVPSLMSADPVQLRPVELRELPRPQLADVLRGTTPDQLIALGREAVQHLGSYRVRVAKRERVAGSLLPLQTMEVAIRPVPRAVRLEVVAGPKSGRRVVWREGFRPSEILVREGGLLGIASLWIDASGKLARRDTNHRVSELGFGPALDFFESDLREGQSQGGHTRRDQGFDGKGRYCLEFSAPPAAQGLYAQRTVICIDPRLGLPVMIEVFDRQGLLERYEYDDVRDNQKFAAALFEDV